MKLCVTELFYEKKVYYPKKLGKWAEKFGQ